MLVLGWLGKELPSVLGAGPVPGWALHGLEQGPALVGVRKLCLPRGWQPG